MAGEKVVKFANGLKVLKGEFERFWVFWVFWMFWMFWNEVAVGRVRGDAVLWGGRRKKIWYDSVLIFVNLMMNNLPPSLSLSLYHYHHHFLLAPHVTTYDCVFLFLCCALYCFNNFSGNKASSILFFLGCDSAILNTHAFAGGVTTSLAKAP